MEVVEEPPLNNVAVDGMKASVVVDENPEKIAAPEESDVCHKSNGVADPSESVESVASKSSAVPIEESPTNNEIKSEVVKNDTEQENPVPACAETDSIQTDEGSNLIKSDCDERSRTDITEVESIQNALTPDHDEKDSCSVEIPLEECVLEVNASDELPTDRVTFETEILIESNDNDDTEIVSIAKVDEDTKNILGELGQNIEFSEALCASDVSANVENNNCAGDQEVFNKEELLDILEGNDVHQSNKLPLRSQKGQKRQVDKSLETKLALDQLSRLKKKPKRTPIKVRRSDGKKIDVVKKVGTVKKVQTVQKEPDKEKTVEDKKEEIVKSLVQDWDDEDANDNEKATKLLEESEKILQATDDLVNTQEVITQQNDTSDRTSIELTDDSTPTLNKSGDEGQPQRRLGRVIKKKVIFDPDNPDTFTKGKTLNKTKEHVTEKEQTPSKKIKVDPEALRAKSKSPISKLHWKKPTPKISQNKHPKRLTEVDRLLMDEGAVNMIYQLTPEAPKGKKNMKTKAEFIKKIQSSTPDTKEMKFRERKKECKYEDGDAKKILGGKQRHSLSSSVKSPSVSEDFEAHSADDSIIYRRHSSSSYSSSCMSPRRLSDVEAGAQPARNHAQTRGSQDVANADGVDDLQTVDVFMSEKLELGAETINKSTCLSIKEKLNSKLNLALKKRKKEAPKPEKPTKQKKVAKSEEITKFKYLSVSIEKRLAQIHVQNSEIKCNVMVIKELQNALAFVEASEDISVTLLTPECVAACSNLDVTPVLEDNSEKKTAMAYEIAESIRCLLQEVCGHNKLLCSGAHGACAGVGLALLALSDVALASERAAFSAPPGPGLAALHALPRPLVNDMIVFGRRLSAFEALQGGLVSRILWPDNFGEQVYNIVRDITAQPAQDIWHKKQILNMKKGESESTFLTHLEKERDLLVKYWTSTEANSA